MPFRFKQKTLVISFLAVAVFGFLFLAYTSSVSASHYATYPYGVRVSSGDSIEYCNSESECDTLCERSANPLACFYFYGDTGLAPQKADYFKRIADRAQKALGILKVTGGPGGCRTSEECRVYVQSLSSDRDAFMRDFQNFAIEGIHVEIGGPEGEVHLKTIIRIAKALEKAAREKIQPPSGCAYGLMCFGDAGITCEGDEGDMTPECKSYMKKTGYADDRTIALAHLIAAKSTDEVGGGPGGCRGLIDCEVYCDAQEHRTECVEFAEKNNLPVEIPDDKKAVFAAMQKGESPGQCKDEASCRNYCEDVDHIGECVDFVAKFNLASPDELKEMRQIADAKKSGVSFPGNCKTKESCLKYCDNYANAVVCMEFAQRAGFIPKEDAAAVDKILPYLKRGGKLPGGCTTKESCDVYCNSDTHTNECIDFAAGAGFMTKEEADIVKKVGGKTPGNCRSREACDSYCEDAAHIDECVDFAVKAGFISEADAADAKKYKIISGPGNCKSKADCEAFCVLPENQDTCFKFAKDHGMISEEDLKNIEQYRNQGPPDFSQVNPKWLVCMENEMGSATFGRFKAGKSDRSDVSAIQVAQKTCQGEMGSDTKECLAKPTCEEFFSCLNPSGRQTSQQGGPEQESPPELKERMDFCKKESVETKKKEVQEKFDACFALSCSEYEACMKSIEQSGDQQDGQQQAQGAPDPKIKAKAETCQKEKINACLAKPCGEFQTCINALGGGGGGGGQSDPAVGAKFQSCQSPPPSGDSGEKQQQSVDRSGVPQGYSSWQEFCTANYNDSRCAR